MSVWFKRVIPSFGAVGFGAVVAAAAVLSVATVAHADKGKEHTKFQDQPFFLGVSGSSIEFLNINGSLYCFAGTLGALVEFGGVQYILSNNHVLARQSEADPDDTDVDAGVNDGVIQIGDPIIQPGLLDENGSDRSCSPANTDYTGLIVGELSDWVPLNFAPQSVNFVDAAIAAVDPNIVDADGRILDIGGLQGTTVFYGLGLLGDLVGMQVQKSGRTTGLTTGTIGAVGAEITVNYSNGSGFFQDQILVTGSKGAFIKSGDSGSLMVSVPSNGDLPQAVGLLFAGSMNGLAIANRIDHVLGAFGVTMVGCFDTFDSQTGEGVDCTATSNAAGSGGTDDESGGPPPGRGNGKFQSGQVPFGLEIAAEARDAHRGSLMANPDVVGTGLSFGENGEPVIQVYTLGARRSAGHAIPNELDGVKVQVIVTGEFRAY
jgi:hypothetical protein